MHPADMNRHGHEQKPAQRAKIPVSAAIRDIPTIVVTPRLRRLALLLPVALSLLRPR